MYVDNPGGLQVQNLIHNGCWQAPKFLHTHPPGTSNSIIDSLNASDKLNYVSVYVQFQYSRLFFFLHLGLTWLYQNDGTSQSQWYCCNIRLNTTRMNTFSQEHMDFFR